jgi:hypothetical protein
VQKRNRVAIASLAIVAIALAGWFWLTRHTNAEPILTDAGPILSVECRQGGAHLTNGEWSLTLDAQGNGFFAKWWNSPIKVSLPKVIPELTKAIRACRLSELPSQVGYKTVDHGVSTMRIKTTNLDKTITIDFVPPSDEDVVAHYKSGA